MTMNPHLQVCDFHGLRLGCRADEALLAALGSRLGRFATCEAGPCDLLFDYRTSPHSTADERGPDARVVYESPMGKVFYHEGTDRLSITSEWQIRAVCDPQSGETRVDVGGPTEPHLWALSHPLLTLPLIETLKRRGRFSIHAAGVARGERCMIIAGSSGSGKSTLALALARAGFGFLGDDMLFIKREPEGLRALALPEAFDVTDQTVKLFPDLADLLQRGKQPGWPKHQVHVDERFGARIVWNSRPSVIVFPRVAHSGTSKLTALSQGEALLELLPNILLTEATSSQQHLDVLTELVSSCACYRLETGTNFTELARELAQLLEN